MTAFKQLLITSTLFLTMHCNAYDACALRNEVTQMLDFAQTLHQVNHPQGLCVAQWLEQQVWDASCNVSDNDILVTANIINNSLLTVQSKISLLSQIIAAKKAEEKTIARTVTLNTISNALMMVAFLGSFTTIAALAIMEERNNPTTKIRITHQFPDWYDHYSYPHHRCCH